MKKFPQLSLISLAVISTFAQAEEIQKLDEIQVTAEQQVKQSLGVSVVTEKDLERNPIENDASEVIAKKNIVNAKNFIQVIYTTSESLVKQYQLGSYGIWGANIGYKFNDSFSLRVGVNNILDKRIYVMQVQHTPIMSVVVLTLLI